MLKRGNGFWTCLLAWLVAGSFIAQVQAAAGAEEASEQKPLRIIRTHRSGPWVFQDVWVTDQEKEQPRLRILHEKGGKKVVLREITPEELPIRDEDCELICAELKDAANRCFGKCVRSGPDFLAFDKKAARVYFQVTTAEGTNVPYLIFSLDINAGKIVRLQRAYGSALSDTSLSPSGQYLAFLIASHLSGFESFWILNIVDTKTGALLQLPSDEELKARAADEIIDIKRFHWLSEHKIAYVMEVRERYDHEKRDKEPRVISRTQRVFAVEMIIFS